MTTYSKNEVTILVGADVEGYAFRSRLGTSNRYASKAEMLKAVRFVFGTNYDITDERLENLRCLGRARPITCSR